MNSAQFNLRIPPEEKRELQDTARELGLSLAGFLRASATLQRKQLERDRLRQQMRPQEPTEGPAGR